MWTIGIGAIIVIITLLLILGVLWALLKIAFAIIEFVSELVIQIMPYVLGLIVLLVVLNWIF